MQARPLKRGLYALKQLHLALGGLKLAVAKQPAPSPCAPLLEVVQPPLIQPPGAAASARGPKLGQPDASGTLPWPVRTARVVLRCCERLS